MAEVIRVAGDYYILATSSFADDRTRVLKQGETFAVFDRFGDVSRLGRGEQGIYHRGTRHVSRTVLTIGGDRPLLLGSTVTEDNVVLAVDVTNADMITDERLPLGTLHVFRSKYLLDGACYEQLRVHNHADRDVDVDLRLEVEADFVDVFEVRGMSRPRRGTTHAPEVVDGVLMLSYEGLDGVVRTTRVSGDPDCETGTEGLSFRARLAAGEERSFHATLMFGEPGSDAYDVALSKRRRAQEELAAGSCEVTTSNELFNDWLTRSLADLRAMITATEHGYYPYAGIPWFSTPFGRDAIITAYESLWLNPSLARGVLSYLAATQATASDPTRESQPGKVIHERRLGEMAALGEVPFGAYYGSADATPLFVVLAGAYHEVTGDLEAIKSIWPNLEAALRWIDEYGDVDGDGFVEYPGVSERGLVQQGWKDSHDSVFHADGTLAQGPIALCEVQAYVYWAKRHASRLALELGDDRLAAALDRAADALRERFEDAFWCDDRGTYALALDGEKRPCRVRTSNAGHCLLAGIVSPDRAERVAAGLLSEEMFSGWGIRTLATDEVRYRPISYHNGSVWPHDNALVAAGFARYGLKQQVVRVLTGSFDASQHLELHRLPELMCGFHRRAGEGPTRYPLACEPQAWAAASVFLLLQACLGLQVDARARQVRLLYPVLPPFLDEVHVAGLRIGDATIDVMFQRYASDVGVNVLGRTGNVEVVTVK